MSIADVDVVGVKDVGLGFVIQTVSIEGDAIRDTTLYIVRVAHEVSEETDIPFHWFER